MTFRKSALAFIATTLLCSVTAMAQPYASREYRIALILPFNTNGTHGTLSDAMLDYYEGFRKAAENLEAEGLNLKLYVFDSEKDTQNMDAILKHPDLPKMDVIVGPVYESPMAEMEAFCTKHKILLVSPLKFCKPASVRNTIINFFVPDSIKAYSIAEEAVSNFPKYKFVVITDNAGKTKEYANHIRSSLLKLGVKNPKILTHTGTTLPATSFPKDSVVLICAVPRLSLRDDLLKSIKSLKHFYLYGHPDWNGNISSTLDLDEDRVIYPEVNYVDNGDSSAVYFRNYFISKMYTEPSKYAYIGYDEATYLCYGLMAFGQDFINHLPNADFRGCINMIHLNPSSAGIVNTGMNYIQIVEEERRLFRR